MKSNPELYLLGHVPWQFFCTLTWPNAMLRKSEALRITTLFSWLRAVAELPQGLHFKRMLWCVRREKGDRTGRPHFHAVIAGLPSHFCNRMTCMAMANTWERLSGGHGRVSEYVATLDGIDYILKGKEMSESVASRWAGDYHELSKFGGSCDVTLSMSVIAYLDQRMSDGRRDKGHELWRQTRHPALSTAE